MLLFVRMAFSASFARSSTRDDDYDVFVFKRKVIGVCVCDYL